MHYDSRDKSSTKAEVHLIKECWVKEGKAIGILRNSPCGREGVGKPNWGGGDEGDRSELGEEIR